MPNSSNSSPFRAVFWGGLLAGIFDITQAYVAWGLFGNAHLYEIFQSIAVGAFGRASYQMGYKSIVAGFFFHFLIAFGAATVYWLASRRIRFMIDHAVIAGLLYGECVYLFMNFVVIPLSVIHRFPHFTVQHVVTGPIGHPFLVGLPIAQMARRYSGRNS